MRVTYDPSVDAAYLYLVDEMAPGGVARTITMDPTQIDGMVNIDLAEDGRIIGIEVLDASRLLPRELLISARRLA